MCTLLKVIESSEDAQACSAACSEEFSNGVSMQPNQDFDIMLMCYDFNQYNLCLTACPEGNELIKELEERQTFAFPLLKRTCLMSVLDDIMMQ